MGFASNGGLRIFVHYMIVIYPFAVHDLTVFLATLSFFLFCPVS